MKVARKLLDFSARREWIFGGERNEFYLAPRVFLSHFFIIRNFATTWSTPSRPDIDDNYFATEISETKYSVVDCLEFVNKESFRQSAGVRGTERYLVGLRAQWSLRRRWWWRWWWRIF